MSRPSGPRPHHRRSAGALATPRLSLPPRDHRRDHARHARTPEPLAAEPLLRALVRTPAEPTGTVTVTVTLVNTQQVGERDLQDALLPFQPRLTVTAAADSCTAFVERPAALGAVDAELATSRLLHRHAPTFAVGHGCAAHWDWTPPPVG